MVQIIRTLDAYSERLGSPTGGDKLPEQTSDAPPPASET
jgi:hypothetical protein